jgi:citrate synthase
MADEQTERDDGGGVATANETLSVTDNRTGESYEVEIEDGTVKAMDFRQVKVSEDDFGLMTYDPAFTNTASVRSSVCFIDGDAGVLEYRGYPIEELCDRSSYLEVAYLLIYGELPTRDQLDEWVFEITHHTFVHENIKKFVEGFRYDAHPMGMLLATVGALSTFYPDAKKIDDELERHMAAVRLIAKMPTLAAFAYRHNLGLPYVYPDNDLTYPGNFLSMMFKMTEVKYEPDPRLERALDVLWILHADHEQNCSTNAVRGVGSSEVDPYSAVAAGVAALYGPLHGGANEAVLRMLERIETTDNIPDFLESVKNRDEKLMGFGHRVYKNYDPRARIIKEHVDNVLEVTGKNPKLELAVELEKHALDDDYFIERKLYPNVDFYSGLIYEALNLPTDMFTVMFAIPRTSGWIAQWLEMVTDSETKIARPRQIYTGAREQSYVPIDKREKRSEKPRGETNLIDPARSRRDKK